MNLLNNSTADGKIFIATNGGAFMKLKNYNMKKIKEAFFNFIKRYVIRSIFCRNEIQKLEALKVMPPKILEMEYDVFIHHRGIPEKQPCSHYFNAKTFEEALEKQIITCLFCHEQLYYKRK